METVSVTPSKAPWNKGKIVGQKAPLKLKGLSGLPVRFV